MVTTAATSSAPTDWISARAARATLGVGQRSLELLIRDRRITTRELPGLPPKLLRADVERLARESTRPAEGVGA